MDKAQNLILDFTYVYPEDIESKVQDIRRVDLSDISGTDMYCTAEAISIDNSQPVEDGKVNGTTNAILYHFIKKISGCAEANEREGSISADAFPSLYEY